MAKTKALNGTGIDRPHYLDVREDDTRWLVGVVVVGVLAAFSPLLFGGYGINWHTIAAALIGALAVRIALGKVEDIDYCNHMIRNRLRVGRRHRRVRGVLQGT